MGKCFRLNSYFLECDFQHGQDLGFCVVNDRLVKLDALLLLDHNSVGLVCPYLSCVVEFVFVLADIVHDGLIG